MSEVPAEPVKMVSLFGKEIPRSSVEKSLYSATAFLVVFNAISIPFALPKLGMFLGAPYLPSNTAAFRAVLRNIPELQSSNLRLVDIGSGDGRLVLEASRYGFRSMGIEMNPWLVLLSKIRLMGSGSDILWGNAWKSEETVTEYNPDVITFYGRPGQGVMTKFGKMAESVSDKTGKGIIVVSNKFPIPNWNIRQIAQVEDFIVYKVHSNKE